MDGFASNEMYSILWTFTCNEMKFYIFSNYKIWAYKGEAFH
jgi:hypothetical protein